MNKKNGILTVQHLANRIEDETYKLRNQFQNEAMDIRFSDKILIDVKRFIAILLFTALRFYSASLKHGDLLKSLL